MVGSQKELFSQPGCHVKTKSFIILHVRILSSLSSCPPVSHTEGPHVAPFCTIHILGVDTDSYHELLGGGLVKNMGEDVEDDTKLMNSLPSSPLLSPAQGPRWDPGPKLRNTPNNLTTYESGGFMIFLYLESIHQKWQYFGWYQHLKDSGHCHLIFNVLDDQAPSVICVGDGTFPVTVTIMDPFKPSFTTATG